MFMPQLCSAGTFPFPIRSKGSLLLELSRLSFEVRISVCREDYLYIENRQEASDSREATSVQDSLDLLLLTQGYGLDSHIWDCKAGFQPVF